MAKDRRKKTTSATRNKPKRKISNRGKRIVWISIAIFVVLAITLTVVAVIVLNKGTPAKANDSKLNRPVTTPESDQGKVAYYAVGLLGEEEISPTTCLFLLCHDKKANTLTVLEVPQATYLGDSDLWIEKKAGNVWGNPAPLDWCDTHGKRLYKAEIAEHESNPKCKVTQKIGSASFGMLSIYNEQYALPTDGYFMIPQAAFIKLVDLLGGVDVQLKSAMTLNDIKFEAGVRTLDGAGALQYLTMGGDSVSADLERIQRQRQVFFALFQRLCAQTDTQLQEDSIIPVMKGSTPLRKPAEMSNDDIVALIQSWRNITADKVTAVTLPGEAATLDGVSYYSVYRAQTIEMLNTYFNPYGKTITEADVTITELVSGGKTQLNVQTMDQIAVEQNIIKPPTE